jgi:hypothetical protein
MNKETIELIKRIERIENKLDLTTLEIGWTKIGDLEWSDNLGEMNWNEAMAKAKEIGARLPKRWEIVKAVDENYDDIQELIKNDPSNTFWASTEYSATNAWYVSLFNGTTYTNTKSTNSSQVRVVRDVK